MLTKMENGKEIICSEEEEISLLTRWAFVNKYPEYQDAVIWDEKTGGAIHDNGIARYDLEKSKSIHLEILQKKCDEALRGIANEIEAAEESGNEVLRASLIQKRKDCKNSVKIDLSKHKSIDDLIQSIPEVLKE